MIITTSCDNCGRNYSTKQSEYKRKKRHFCSRECYSIFRATKLPMEEQHAWKGGISHAESHRKWAARNKDKIKAANRARRLRELNAPGSHTPEEWEEVKIAANYTCEVDDETCKGGITKEHKVPLVRGGSNDKSNLQVLCRSHNSRKRHRIYSGFEPEY